jgi:hypothetical protein
MGCLPIRQELLFWVPIAAGDRMQTPQSTYPSDLYVAETPSLSRRFLLS